MDKDHIESLSEQADIALEQVDIAYEQWQVWEQKVCDFYNKNLLDDKSIVVFDKLPNRLDGLLLLCEAYSAEIAYLGSCVDFFATLKDGYNDMYCSAMRDRNALISNYNIVMWNAYINEN